VLPCGKTARKNLSGASRPEARHLDGVTAAHSIAYKPLMNENENEIEITQLREAVENMHGGTATLAQSVPARETFEGKPVWEGVVHVLDLAGHPTATRAYAWSSPIEGSTKRWFFTVLHAARINAPLEAVRAAIVAERRK